MSQILACDWGTTNLRAWVVDDAGQVVRAKDFALGVSVLGPGEAERCFLEQVRPEMEAQSLPAVLCGMIGSTLGWAVADYVECPAGAQELGRHLLRVEGGAAPIHIAPGLRCAGLTGASDVMRGEETQVIGWLSRDAARTHGRWIVLHPGTHAKWIEVIDGRIVRFITAMTGELFAVLSHHGVLKTNTVVDDAKAFDAGVTAAADGGALAGRLFSARARVVADGAPPASAASYLSGLLIGAEVAALPALLEVDASTPVAVLGDPGLCRWYARALGSRPHTSHNGDRAALAGLTLLATGIDHDA